MRALALAFILAWTSIPTHAASLNTSVVRAGCGGNLNVDTRVLHPEIVGLGVSAGPPATSEVNCSAGASAFAGAGVARVQASIDNPGRDDSTALIRGEASAFAQLTYDFIVKALITDPDPFEFSINMSASGSIGAVSNELFSDTGKLLNAGQVISSGLRITGSLRTRSDSDNFEERIAVRVSPGEEDTGVLSGDFTTPSILVTPGDRITFTFGLEGGTSGQLIGQSASGRVSAERSLSFSTRGPVFNVPDGYAVLIDEPRLIGNRYYAPETPLPPAPVPLPASGWVLLSGLITVLVAGRRRDRV
ncbi:MAG: hypothetical protein AAFU66_04685 [Pseudomonadota bacterium]